MSDASPHKDDLATFMAVFAGAVLVALAAFGLGALLKINPLTTAAPTLWALGVGVAATAPLVLLLQWFIETDIAPLKRFRESQIDYFANIGFRFTPLRMALLALGAGISEELLFRGVLQAWIAGGAPLIAAILLPNIIFGALHARTSLYAFIAGGVGVYFGVLFALTGNILAPIVAHTLYDWVAFLYTRREIDRRAVTID